MPEAGRGAHARPPGGEACHIRVELLEQKRAREADTPRQRLTGDETRPAAGCATPCARGPGRRAQGRRRALARPLAQPQHGSSAAHVLLPSAADARPSCGGEAGRGEGQDA
eukprot:scaffold1890_cov380-Prasinococcus_capsulatus_cf.AAC.12